ncbi:MAG TPA: hypothetical protein ENJ79_03760 [Gammaproteobacteria bacterium]|nr:hypothetical protein [Gammaproteobacteria bacterium]
MRESKIVWIMVAVATTLMFLFLPTFTFHEDGLKGEYHFILNIPADHQINGPLILVEWLGIMLMAAITWTLIGSRNNKAKKDEESGTAARKAVDEPSTGAAGSSGEKQSEDDTETGRSRK